MREQTSLIGQDLRVGRREILTLSSWEATYVLHTTGLKFLRK